MTLTNAELEAAAKAAEVWPKRRAKYWALSPSQRTKNKGVPDMALQQMDRGWLG